jgi:hypothetical protein
VELVGLLALDDPGEARVHRVDQDEVARLEQAVGVVDESERRGRHGPHVAGVHEARSEQTQVQPHGGGTGAAVEGEGHGSSGLGVLLSVGDEEDLGLRLEAVGLAVPDLLTPQHEAARGRRVLQARG